MLPWPNDVRISTVEGRQSGGGFPPSAVQFGVRVLCVKHIHTDGQGRVNDPLHIQRLGIGQAPKLFVGLALYIDVVYTVAQIFTLKTVTSRNRIGLST
ncbi:hypothetical protein GWI33_022332 [Rhynchophorus ferrugineus]|uniref:Uncharacterized protein n=1 Tax=Rhynchophorus ferrugineus TaxID=354439 RepID=A0A834M257_RHYFE|nr:hypothetical protein GWI33_022333 [Rhynchophorus ferrugineus]KAF7264811.1 hypothetical protein GWI33_022332 [Rhynchophorus ferrugineus]